MKKIFNYILISIILNSISLNTMLSQTTQPEWMNASIKKIERNIGSQLDDYQLIRLDKGLKQVSNFWRQEDGDQVVFESFVVENFMYDEKLDSLFYRLQRILEAGNGYMQEMSREFRQQTDLDLGLILPVDEIIAGYNPSAHMLDDFFKNKIAFIVLLNFPLTTLQERLTDGQSWSRRKWAEVRLAQMFSIRIPSAVNQEISEAGSKADQYIAEYNIWMHHLTDNNGTRLFPPKMRLLSHWNLRDEIKADYSDSDNGLNKQKMIQQVMERIVTQTIPEVVIDNPAIDWNPFTNEVQKSTMKDWDSDIKATSKITNDPEPDTRYKNLLNTFLSVKKADPYSPVAPTHIARRFEINREIPEAEVKNMFEQVLSSPLIPRIAKLIEERLGRPLEPFDIWYNGFKPRSVYSETELNEKVSKKYPTPKAFEEDIPNILKKFGFTNERAEYIANNIVVDPARGSGHAMGAAMRTAKAHLRTRVGKDGMDYKGFNIAVHELGHNVEQTISLNNIDYYMLQGVPNTAFTEALAFVFQGHDLELLGLSTPDEKNEALKVLNDFWATYEISGVALVDMAVWHWMYDNPDATPVQLKEAVLNIAKDTWNKYYASVFNKKDVVLLGIYSHMIDGFMYLPDYPLGHLIAFQLEEQMKKAGSIGPEFERIARLGSIAPDLWMKEAAGSPVGAEALIKAAEKALGEL